MTPSTWRRHVGDAAFDHLLKTVAATPSLLDGGERLIADLLTQAVEVGFRAPEVAPINVDANKVLWPSSQDTNVAALTGAGLERYYTSKGHRYYVLRVPEMVRAASGPLMSWLQSLLAAYEEQCQISGVDPLPAWADAEPFVGGDTAKKTSGFEE